jgi:aminopeptidase N
VFRALVYNKGAAVLHMLRQLVGDEAFFRGLRRFYAENRFRKAGTDDLQRAMEEESDRRLERFFERWIWDSSLPRLRVTTSIEGQELLVKAEQAGEIFDMPLLVSVTYTDGRTEERIIAVTEALVEARLPLSGNLRQVEFNQDHATLATIDRR